MDSQIKENSKIDTEIPWYKRPLRGALGIGAMIVSAGVCIASLVLATKFPALAATLSTTTSLAVIQHINNTVTTDIITETGPLTKPSATKGIAIAAAVISLVLGIGGFFFPPLAMADSIVGLIFSACGLGITVADTIKINIANQDTSVKKNDAVESQEPGDVIDTIRNGLKKALDFIVSPKGIKIITTIAVIVLGACAIAFPPTAMILGAVAGLIGIASVVLGVVSTILQKRAEAAANTVAVPEIENTDAHLEHQAGIGSTGDMFQAHPEMKATKSVMGKDEPDEEATEITSAIKAKASVDTEAKDENNKEEENEGEGVQDASHEHFGIHH